MNHLFFAKLSVLLCRATSNEKWMANVHKLEAMPDDMRHRVMLMTPEIRGAFPEYSNYKPRFRLAWVVGNAMVACETAQLEVYSADGTYMLRCIPIGDLTNHQSLAVQTELFYALLDKAGAPINSL